MSTTTQETYTVALDAFHGPLDLLLYLIRRAEVDITDIPIAAITDQYLAILHAQDDIDLELAGEFLLMAATLIEVKSRTISPPAPKDEEGHQGSETGDLLGASSSGEENNGLDPREDLVRSLLAYQRFRVASEELEERRVAFTQRWPVRMKVAESSETVEPDPVEFELEDLHLLDLSEAYENIAAAIDFTRLGEHRVDMDETPIALYQEDLLDRLHREQAGRLILQNVFRDLTETGTGGRIGLFLATLELVRLRQVTVIQDDIDAEIELVLQEDESDPPQSHEFEN